MINRKRKGNFALFTGNEFTEPCIVFVGGINGFGWLVLNKVNESITFFEDPDMETLLDACFKKLELIKAEWDLEKAKRVVPILEKRLSELKDKS